MLPKQYRLTSGRDFRRVFEGGKTYVHRLFVLKVLPRSGEPTRRFAFSASSKFKSAVARNRTKRLLREAVQILGERVKLSGYDVVMIARPPMRDAHFSEVSRAVEEMFRKANLLISAQPGE